MNGAPLPVAHGAPLRLRVERQLGYKQAKYVMRIEAVDGLRPHRPAARAASGKTAATNGTRGSTPPSLNAPVCEQLRPAALRRGSSRRRGDRRRSRSAAPPWWLRRTPSARACVDLAPASRPPCSVEDEQAPSRTSATVICTAYLCISASSPRISAQTTVSWAKFFGTPPPTMNRPVVPAAILMSVSSRKSATASMVR